MTEQTYTLSNCEILRLDVDTDHFYYGAEIGGEKQFWLGVTTILDIGGPFPQGLRDWLSVTNYEDQKERFESTGRRGTALHEALDLLMKKQEINLKSDFPTQYEKDAITTFIRVMRFLTPTKVETEQIVGDPELKLAGTLDLKCIADNWKLEALLNPTKYLMIDSESDLVLQEKWLGLPEEITGRSCIVWDHKFTGRNTYNHELQVAEYKTMYNKSHKGTKVSRAFTWRYSPKHKFGFDFNESLLTHRDFKRVYDTAISYLGKFPAPPTIKRFPEKVRLYEA